MKKIMIQFHATLEELVEFLNSTSTELGLFLTVMVVKPFSLRTMGEDLSIESLNIDGDIRVILTPVKPFVEASSPNEFYDSNPGTIGLHVGRITELGLEESSLAFMSDNKEMIAVANKVASKLRKVTKSGVIAVNPVNGAEASVRSHRYTEGAKELYDGGVKILPAAGNSILKLSN